MFSKCVIALRIATEQYFNAVHVVRVEFTVIHSYNYIMPLLIYHHLKMYVCFAKGQNICQAYTCPKSTKSNAWSPLIRNTLPARAVMAYANKLGPAQRTYLHISIPSSKGGGTVSYLQSQVHHPVSWILKAFLKVMGALLSH